MCYMFSNYADTYDAKREYDENHYTLLNENEYWKDIRPFIPHKGNKLKGFKI